MVHLFCSLKICIQEGGYYTRRVRDGREGGENLGQRKQFKEKHMGEKVSGK